jgi:hypothetical protein
MDPANARDKAANDAFERYDHDPARRIVDCTAWLKNGLCWRTLVLLEDQAGVIDWLVFTIIFLDSSDEVVDAYYDVRP